MPHKLPPPPPTTKPITDLVYVQEIPTFLVCLFYSVSLLLSDAVEIFGQHFKKLLPSLLSARTRTIILVIRAWAYQ